MRLKLFFSNKNEHKSEKNFGQIFFLLFFIIAIYPLFKGGNLKVYLLILSIIILSFAYLLPQMLKIPNKIWLKFGVILSKFMTPLILAIMYLVTIVPIGVFFKFTNRDPLKLKKLPKSTYWIKRDKLIGSMRVQF